jgi:hypothetical protein
VTTVTPRARAFTGSLTVAAPIDVAFALFSPEGERLWVPTWNPQPIHPPGVKWAQGQLFRTQEERGEGLWVISRLDRDAHEVEYYRFEPGRYVAHIAVTCAASGPDRTTASVTYEFVGLTDIGNQDIEAMTDDEYVAKMKRWEGWIAGYPSQPT